jgi:transposase InsO family protein
LESNIFSRFGLPLEIISDNGPTFISTNLIQFLSKFGVKQFTSFAYYPQGNGKAESTNNNIVKILKNIIDDRPRQWHILLTYVLWADRTTSKSSTGHIPFQLLYGQEAIMPIERELTSLRLALQDKELNSTNISQRMNAFLTLEE